MRPASQPRRAPRPHYHPHQHNKQAAARARGARAGPALVGRTPGAARQPAAGQRHAAAARAAADADRRRRAAAARQQQRRRRGGRAGAALCGVGGRGVVHARRRRGAVGARRCAWKGRCAAGAPPHVAQRRRRAHAPAVCGPAGALGLRPGCEVALQPLPGVGVAAAAVVEPAGPADWEVVDLNAGLLEAAVLGQVRHGSARRAAFAWPAAAVDARPLWRRRNRRAGAARRLASWPSGSRWSFGRGRPRWC